MRRCSRLISARFEPAAAEVGGDRGQQVAPLAELLEVLVEEGVVAVVLRRPLVEPLQHLVVEQRRSGLSGGHRRSSHLLISSSNVRTAASTAHDHPWPFRPRPANRRVARIDYAVRCRRGRCRHRGPGDPAPPAAHAAGLDPARRPPRRLARARADVGLDRGRRSADGPRAWRGRRRQDAAAHRVRPGRPRPRRGGPLRHVLGGADGPLPALRRGARPPPRRRATGHAGGPLRGRGVRAGPVGATSGGRARPAGAGRAR